ncbi:MAG: permease [Bacillota bacterium]|nr:permease [Bacillota bacterium]
MWKAFVDLLTYQWLGLTKGTHPAEALNFFIYDTVKIFFLLAVIIFVITVLRTFLPPEKTRKFLSQKFEFVGNILAALVGIITPFCSCSAVPLFIGFVEAGVPLGVTFSFLISSPMVNEVALIMLWGLFGWKIALLYIGAGLTVAIVGGYVIGRLKLEHLVQDYVWEIKVGEAAATAEMTWRDRFGQGVSYTRWILKRVWIWVLVGIGIGALIHGYVPQDFLVNYAGRDNLFAVPLAVLLGVPLYSNAAGMIPVVHALMEKGMALGTVLAFMMAVTALSLPEMIILKNVLKIRLIGIFAGILAVAIIAVGYLFNAVVHI